MLNETSNEYHRELCAAALIPSGSRQGGFSMKVSGIYDDAANYFSSKKDEFYRMGRRGIAAGLLAVVMTGCGGNNGGGGGGGGGPVCGNGVCEVGETPDSCPSDCPKPEYKITTSVTGRIDGDLVTAGRVSYFDASSKEVYCELGAAGSCDVNLKAGTYSRIITPPGSEFVKHKDTTVTIGSADATLNDSVIKFGANSTGVDFTQTVLDEYKQTVQRGTSGTGKLDPLPTEIVIVGSAFPDSCKGPGSMFEKFVNDYTTVANEDTSFYSGGKMKSVPVVLGTPTDLVDGTMEVSGWDGITSTDYPKVDNYKIKRARTRWGIDMVCNTPTIITFAPLISHEYDFAWGRGFFNGPDKDPINHDDRSARPTSIYWLDGQNPL